MPRVVSLVQPTRSFCPGVVVFDVGGNQFRLIAAVHYDRQKVFVLRFYPHHEYSRGDWKREL